MKITEALLAEHFVFHNIFDYLERRVPATEHLCEVKAHADMLEAMLEAHSKMEDELVIEPLSHCLDNLGQAENFEAEHEEIDKSLASIRETTELADAQRKLINAVRWSRKHFDKEERIVFPLAEKWLKEKTLQDLGDSWMKERKHVLG